MESNNSSAVASQIIAPHPSITVAQKLATHFGTSRNHFPIEHRAEDAYIIRYMDPAAETNNEAFKIFVDPRTINIRNLKFADDIPQSGATTHSGKQLLQGIVSVGQATERNIFINEDISSINVPVETEEGEEARINNFDLPKLKIFTTGQSYYNSLNFLSDKHNEDLSKNRAILDKTVGKTFKTRDRENIVDGFGVSMDSLQDMKMGKLGEMAKQILDRKQPLTEDFNFALNVIIDSLPFAYKNRELKYGGYNNDL